MRRTETSGSVPSLSWVYDRWGNRTQQNVTAGIGPSPQYGINTATNQIVGFSYDAAGNMTYDGTHSYTYDAEGNIVTVDGGSTATYVYNALNQRVRSLVGSTPAEFVFNAGGQRVSEWNASTHVQIKGHYYWGGTPVAYYDTSATHFEHQDWLGTERMRTTSSGAVEGKYTSLPWGDGQSTSGTDTDPNHYAMLDHDSESDTDHAQFRQYSNVQGRFMAPDPYDGSYDASNPQSMNRYVYAMNNPLSNVDPSGKECVWDDGSYDEDGDPNTGSPGQCQALGGTWIELGLGGEWSPPPAAPQLSYVTLMGGPGSNVWLVQWVVDPASTTGGIIVQYITMTDADGYMIDQYWEPWTVPPGSQYTTYHDANPTNPLANTDDMFANDAGLTVNAQAIFYPGQQMPAVFVATDPLTSLSGQLPISYVNPNLPVSSSPATIASPPVNRTFVGP
jgi:RHS repeat-associated protein